MNTLPFAAFTSLLLATTAFAQKSTIAGSALGPNGQPLANAEIRIHPENKKSPPIAVKSNAQGAYVARDLPVGSYIVAVVGKGGAVTAGARVKTKANETARVDFGARAAAAAATEPKKRARFIPAATGSHMAGFERTGQKAPGEKEGASAQNVERLNPAALGRLQSGSQMGTGGPR